MPLADARWIQHLVQFQQNSSLFWAPLPTIWILFGDSAYLISQYQGRFLVCQILWVHTLLRNLKWQSTRAITYISCSPHWVSSSCTSDRLLTTSSKLQNSCNAEKLQPKLEMGNDSDIPICLSFLYAAQFPKWWTNPTQSGSNTDISVRELNSLYSALFLMKHRFLCTN